MDGAQRRPTAVGAGDVGGLLVAVAFVGLVAAYPPFFAVEALLGSYELFVPLFLSVAALLVAAVGGVLLADAVASSQTESSRRFAVRVAVPVGTVAVGGVYLVVVSGVGATTPAITGPLAVAAVAGLVPELFG
ncbi:hypothetical protein BRC88_00490 [Halobacteriales archaeon QS_4_69_225]|nr:MAG: hypothetical protein BRC88_00490 [Halobacteriales archaeon QS_4_69_225]